LCSGKSNTKYVAPTRNGASSRITTPVASRLLPYTESEYGNGGAARVNHTCAESCSMASARNRYPSGMKPPRSAAPTNASTAVKIQPTMS
jgi:hypothetical protein